VYAVALDVDAETLDFYQNGNKRFECDSFTIDGPFFPTADRGATAASEALVINFGQDSSFAGNKTAQGNQDDNGKGDFYYAPPTDYLALCTDNLSDPEIKLPGEHFNTVLYTGDGAVSHAITGVGFQPDMNWVKARSFIKDHNLVDSVRGAHFRLIPNGTNAENEDAEKIISLDSDGFTTGVDGATNDNTETYASWNWKAGGAPTVDNSAGAGATPTAGSVKIDGSNLGSALAGDMPAIRLSANTTSGFSIVKYEGQSNGATTGNFAHGLSEPPELVIIKNLVQYNWIVYSKPAGNDGVLVLNNNSAFDTNSDFQDTTPSASVVYLGASGSGNEDDVDHIAYCFHSVEGYSKVGGYEGNGNADGTFIYTGFKPAFVMFKKYDGGTDSWEIIDDKRPGYNVSDKGLFPDTNAVEASSRGGDLVSNGVKLRFVNGTTNQSSCDYIYLAFAESPFKYSNAR